jgi:hypothetical protein
MQNATTNKELRSFGLLVGGVFAGIGLWPMLVHGGDYRPWALILAALLIAPALIFPRSLGPIHKVWMKLGHVLGWINTRIILGAVFYLVVTPIGILRRLLGKDPMGKRLRADTESYRVVREPRPASHLIKQY